MRKIIINSFLAIALIAIGYGVMNHLKSLKKKKPSVSYKAPSNHFETIKIKNQDQQIDVAKQGLVINKTSISISPEVTGKIVWASELNEGQTVKKGELLFKIDNTTTLLQLKTLKSDFLQKFANILIYLESDYPEQKDKWYAFFNQLKIDKPLPKFPNVTNTKEKTFLASKGIYKQYYSIQQQEHIASKYTIRSPYSGIVTNIKSKIGSVVSQNTPLLSISKNNALEIKIAFPSKLIQYIKKGKKVTFGTNYAGNISRIEKTIDRSTQSISVYVSPQNPSLITEGEYTEVMFQKIKVPNSSQLPLSALYNGNDVVIVLPDSTTTTKKLNIIYKSTTHIYSNSLDNNTSVIKSIGKDFIIGKKIK